MPESPSSSPRLPAHLDRIVSYFVISEIPKTNNHAASTGPSEGEGGFFVSFSLFFFFDESMAVTKARRKNNQGELAFLAYLHIRIFNRVCICINASSLLCCSFPRLSYTSPGPRREEASPYTTKDALVATPSTDGILGGRGPLLARLPFVSWPRKSRVALFSCYSSSYFLLSELLVPTDTP